MIEALDLQEQRRVLRELPPEKRSDALFKSPELRRAALLAPAIVSGLTPEIHAVAVKRALEDRYGPALEEIDELAAAVEVVERALTVARREALELAGIRGKEAEEA